MSTVYPLSPEQAAAVLANCNLRIALTLDNTAPALKLIEATAQSPAPVAETVPAAETLTIAYAAMGARGAIEDQDLGCLPAEVSDHFGGELGFIDAVTREAWRLDVVAYAIEAKDGGLPGVFCYEIAEPFGEFFAKALIAQHMGGALQADPDRIAERVFADFAEPSQYQALLTHGMQLRSHAPTPAPASAPAYPGGATPVQSAPSLAWSIEDSAAATAEGWDVFHNNEFGSEIERIDAPEDTVGNALPPPFASDFETIGHVYAKAQEGSSLHQKALLLTLQQMRGFPGPVTPVHAQLDARDAAEHEPEGMKS